MKFFQTDVKLVKGQDIISFLKNHDKHSSGGLGGLSIYSHNVKIMNLRLGELTEKAYLVLESSELMETFYSQYVTTVCSDFEKKVAPINALFSGRSMGHLELFLVERVYNPQKDRVERKLKPFFYESEKSLVSMSIEDLRYYGRTVRSFDMLCDRIRDNFIDFVRNAQIALA